MQTTTISQHNPPSVASSTEATALEAFAQAKIDAIAEINEELAKVDSDRDVEIAAVREKFAAKARALRAKLREIQGPRRRGQVAP